MTVPPAEPARAPDPTPPRDPLRPMRRLWAVVAAAALIAIALNLYSQWNDAGMGQPWRLTWLSPLGILVLAIAGFIGPARRALFIALLAASLVFVTTGLVLAVRA